MRLTVWAALVACLAAIPLRADFSYQEDSKVTGGALAGVMKFAGAFSKQAREPMVSHVYVKEHRIAHVNAHSAEITDVDKETMTHIDFDRKTYSVMTFAQFRDMMQQMSDQMKQKMDEEKQKNPDANVNMQVKVSANPTGQTKDIDGLSAKEMVLTMTMQGTDPKTGQTGSMDVKSDMWMASVPGYDQVRDVYKIMGEKIGFVPGRGGFLTMQRPDLSKDMGELYKEMAKMDGMPIETVVQMGGTGNGTSTNANSTTNSNQNSNQSQSAQAPSASEAARSAALGRLGSLGGFGGFGRHKKHPDQDQEQQQQQQQTAQPASDSGAPQSSGLLMEITTRSSNFSSTPVDENNFAVPAGFKQVEPAMERQTKGR